MKRVFVMMALAMLSAISMAGPVRRGQWRDLKLADGTVVRAELRGDAFLHFWQDAEGYRYVQAPDADYFQLADMQQLQRSSASRRNAPARSAAQQGGKKAGRRNFPIGAEHATPLEGTHRELLILVNFSDCKFESNHTQAFYNEMVNTKGYANMSDGLYGSVRDYFEAQSDGKFSMQFDVVGPITLNHPYAYYGQNDTYYNQDAQPELMIIDAVRAVDDQVDFSKYDNDGDGYVDQVFVLYAGKNESAGGDANTVWPHKFTISYTASNNYKPLIYDNTYIDDYACSSELTWYGYEQNASGGYDMVFGVAGIGVFCHEFSHCLGLPDVYDVAGENYGMNTYSLLDAGEWNGINAPGITPPEFTAYERMYCGWRQPTVLNADTTIRGMKPISLKGETFIIYNQANHNEYYLLENRQLVGWDEALEGYGLLVTHVDFDQKIWENNIVNCTSEAYHNGLNDHQRLHLVAADNSYATQKIDPVTGYSYYDYDDVLGDCYPHGNLDSLSNWSIPRANLYNTNSNGTKLLNVGVLNIRQNADKTIDFDFRASAGTGSGKHSGEAYFYESFDKTAGTGGNDGLWGGGANVGSAALTPDNTGWTGTIYGGDKCARVGASRGSSSVLSPEFGITGATELSFLAAPWQGDEGKVTLSLYCADDDVENFSLGQAEFTLAEGEWTRCTTTLTGVGKVQIRFTPAKRIFIDEVQVLEPGNAVRNFPMVDRTTPQPVYDMSGRRVANLLPGQPLPSSLPNGIYVHAGRKIVK